MTNPTIFALIRHALTVLGGWLLSKGVLDDASMVEELAGALVTLLGIGWSIWHKYKVKESLQSARGGDPAGS